MAEQATERMTVRADPARCFEVAVDFDRYPEWAADIKEVDVVERDAEGRATLVAFRTAALGRSTSYTLRYDYEGAPGTLSWVLDHGDLTRKLDGSYTFDVTEGGDTEVTYHLVAELVVPVPGFVKRRAEGRVMHAALKEFKARAERAQAQAT